MTETTPTNDPLVGKFFLTLNDEGGVKYQGEFKAPLQGGHYLVQFYSWVAGEATEMGVLHVSQLQTNLEDQQAPGSVLVFADADQRDFFLEKHNRREAA